MVDGVSNPAVAPVPPAGAAPKNPLVSAIVSLIIPGVGQMLNGQMKKGIILLIGSLVLWGIIIFINTMGAFILTAFTVVGGLCCCFGYLIPLVVNLYAAYDAYKTANDINAGIFVKDWMS
jgi:TM2 domain-containing membrane protein YozV